MLDFPNSPTNGQTYVGPGNVLWQFDGVKWLASQGGGGIFVVISDTAPPNPAVGTFWWDSTAAQLFLFYYDGNSSQWVQANSLTADAASTIALAQHNTGRNLIHNPLFNIQQRGQGPWTVSANYTADRWRMWLNGGTQSTSVITLTDADRSAIGDEAARYGLQAVVTGGTAVGNNQGFSQQIETIRRLSGKTVTISFYAKASVSGLKVGVGVWLNMGSGGSPSANRGLNGVLVPITTAWANYSVTLAVPSTAGLTFGTNGDDSFETDFYLSDHDASVYSGALGVQSGTFTLWGVQLEVQTPGHTAPSPLEKIDPVQDLQRCQRFFQIGSALNWGGASGVVSIYSTVSLPVRMRATATCTFVIGSTPNVTGGQVYGQDPGSLTLAGSTQAAGGYGLSTTFTASADL
jgi:hypothetical protein